MKKSSKAKSVKNTAPTWFKTPYNRLWYVLIQDPKQFSNFAEDHSALASFANELYEDHFKAMTYYATNVEGELVAVIYYPTMFESSEDEALTVLCHECVHVWQEFVEGMNEREPSREFEAYTIDEIFGNVLREYRSLVEVKKAHTARKSLKKKEPDLI